MASSIKVSYEGEMRRFAASTYEDLQKRVSSLFDLDSFLLKYQDEEGDLVTVSSEWELEEALRCQGPVLRLNVEATDDLQSGDFILVERDCVVHVDQTAELQSFPSPLTPATSQAISESAPMVLSPLPHAQSSQDSISAQTSFESTPSSQEASPQERVSLAPQNGAKRTYAEACESKVPYSQGAHKVPTYIISVTNSPKTCDRAKVHAVSSTGAIPYVKAAKSDKPYAKGKDGAEFTQTPKVFTPYAQGKSSPAYVRPLEDTPYVSQSHAAKPFMQVK